MKRLLMLGGADIQISAIKKARELGYYVITCDYLPDNPGHEFSNEYHNVSTTEKEKVLELAKTLRIDGISAYASDPAALTAAYVAEKLGLPGNPYNSVLDLSDKLRFRSTQRDAGIQFPDFREASEADQVCTMISCFPHGLILKPVDTSGSKGVYRFRQGINDGKTGVEAAIADALGYSRFKKLIVEEYVPRKGNLMSGDFMIENGKIIFMCFGDVHFNDRINGLVPRSISLPAGKDQQFFEKAKVQLQKIIDSLSISTGVFNADIIEREDSGEPLIIDIGARNGGNMFNDIISYHTGVDLIGLSMKQCCGEPVDVTYEGAILGYYAHNVIHSEKDGYLLDVQFSAEIEPMIIYRNIGKKRGERVSRFVNSSFRIGLILLHSKDQGKLLRVLADIHNHINVITATEKTV